MNLQTVSKWFWRSSALLFCAAGVRFAVTAWPAHSVEPATAADAGHAASRSPAALAEPVQRYLPPVSADPEADSKARPGAEALPALVFVTSSRERSEVRIDEQLVGRTPYMGQLRCADGEPVEVSLHYANGEARRFSRRCAGEIRVDDR